MGTYDLTCYDMIARNADLFGQRPAWFEADDQRQISFAKVRQDVDQLACGLEAKGVHKGDRIAVMGHNSYEFFLVYGAAAAIGAIVVPVNWRLTEDEVAFIFQDVRPVAVFADQAFQTLVDGLRSDLASVTVVCNLKANQGDMDSFAALMASNGKVSKAPVGSDDGFVIIHTAAVAGRPRGALLSHGNLLCANLHLINCFGTTETDVHLNLLPMFHVGGLGMLLHSFHAGALNVNMSKFDAAEAVRLIAEKSASLMFEFSPILKSILDEQENTGADISSMRNIMGLDAPETIERYQKATGGTFYTLYGQTETSMLASCGTYNQCPGAAGRPIALARLQLVDDDDRPVGPGKDGEIVMRGPMVFKGYWGLDVDNAQTFRNGWHHTGDLGRLDENGFLWYAGRKPDKELIKPGGENVYPAEVEKVILEHPAVAETVVFGVPDPKWKEGIKAVCVLKNGSQLTAADLIDFVGARIARYKKPQYVDFVDGLTLKADGSVDRAKAKQQYGGDQG